MGNCQAIDAAALVIQHPSGKIERFYWPMSASEVMRTNPGHYVSLIIPLPGSDHDHQEQQQQQQNQEEHKTVRFTRVKLLRPNETLALGHAYRLVTTQEVMKVLRAKKYAKTKKQQLESVDRSQAGQEKQSSSCEAEEGSSDKENINHAKKHERHRPRTASNAAAASAAMRSKSWRPSLQSISEAGS